MFARYDPLPRRHAVRGEIPLRESLGEFIAASLSVNHAKRVQGK
jgi:hypothetical protein